MRVRTGGHHRFFKLIGIEWDTGASKAAQMHGMRRRLMCGLTGASTARRENAILRQVRPGEIEAARLFHRAWRAQAAGLLLLAGRHNLASGKPVIESAFEACRYLGTLDHDQIIVLPLKTGCGKVRGARAQHSAVELVALEVHRCAVVAFGADLDGGVIRREFSLCCLVAFNVGSQGAAWAQMTASIEIAKSSNALLLENIFISEFSKYIDCRPTSSNLGVILICQSSLVEESLLNARAKSRSGKFINSGKAFW
jgi:hypothetical protein